jgi:hypothetical protein
MYIGYNQRRVHLRRRQKDKPLHAEMQVEKGE